MRLSRCDVASKKIQRQLYVTIIQWGAWANELPTLPPPFAKSLYDRMCNDAMRIVAVRVVGAPCNGFPVQHVLCGVSFVRFKRNRQKVLERG